MPMIRRFRPYSLFIGLRGLACAFVAAALSMGFARAETASTSATVSLSTSGPSSVFVDNPAPAQVIFTIRNDGSSATPASTMLLNWPTLPINGVPDRPNLVAIDAGGAVTDLSNVDSGEVSVLLPPIAPGASRAVALSLRYPAGIIDSSVHTIAAQVTVAPGDTANAAHAWLLRGTPQLQVQVSADQATVELGGALSFTGRHRSTGAAVTRHTYSFGAIPIHTRFISAELGVGRRLLCAGPPADQGLPSAIGQFTATLIETVFTPGLQSGNDWTCPQGNDTSWVAVALDDLALTPPLFPTGVDETWRLQLLHDGEICRSQHVNREPSAAITILPMRLGILATSLFPSESNTASTALRFHLFVDGFETDPSEPTPLPDPCR